MWHLLLVATRLQRRYVWPCMAAIPLAWWLIALSGSENPEGQWVWTEAIFIPIGVLISADCFVGRYERKELEPFLARRSASQLYVLLMVPVAASLVIFSVGANLWTTSGGGLEAAARSVLMLGVMHLLLTLTRNRWLSIGLFCLWWLVGFFYMQDWATASDAVAMWHPLRLSGGGQVAPALEWQVLAAGTVLCLLSWVAVGKDSRWVQ